MYQVNSSLLLNNNNNTSNNSNISSKSKVTSSFYNKWRCKECYKKIFSIKILLIYIVFLTLFQYRTELASIFKVQSNDNNEYSQTSGINLSNKWHRPPPIMPLIQEQRRIVLWTPYYVSFDDYAAAGLHASTFNTCPYSCQVVPAGPEPSKFKLLSTDAVIMTDVPKTLPKTRHPDQTWVFVLHETPSYTKNFSHITFNLTMTYRLDSDIYHPFGSLIKFKPNSTDSISPLWASFTNSINTSSNKTRRLAVIQLSHCNTKSNRESFLRELNDTIPIDIYGSCGNVSCRPKETKACRSNVTCRYEESARCFQEFGRQYKFYLAFENSLCLDYVTEKFYFSLANGMIPVVYGGANYSAFAPNHSYINAREFSSASDLAYYLLWLDSNQEEYLRYFEWRKDYDGVDTSMMEEWCSLCTRLHTGSENKKSYANMDDWWGHASAGDENGKIDGAAACEPRPKFHYSGWADKRKNSQYK